METVRDVSAANALGAVNDRSPAVSTINTCTLRSRARFREGRRPATPPPDSAMPGPTSGTRSVTQQQGWSRRRSRTMSRSIVEYGLSARSIRCRKQRPRDRKIDPPMPREPVAVSMTVSLTDHRWTRRWPSRAEPVTTRREADRARVSRAHRRPPRPRRSHPAPATAARPLERRTTCQLPPHRRTARTSGCEYLYENAPDEHVLTEKMLDGLQPIILSYLPLARARGYSETGFIGIVR